jgi:hypothetical protein
MQDNRRIVKRQNVRTCIISKSSQPGIVNLRQSPPPFNPQGGIRQRTSRPWDCFNAPRFANNAAASRKERTQAALPAYLQTKCAKQTQPIRSGVMQPSALIADRSI